MYRLHSAENLLPKPHQTFHKIKQFHTTKQFISISNQVKEHFQRNSNCAGDWWWKRGSHKNMLCTIQHFIRALISWKINHWKKCNLESRKKGNKNCSIEYGKRTVFSLPWRNAIYNMTTILLKQSLMHYKCSRNVLGY